MHLRPVETAFKLESNISCVQSWTLLFSQTTHVPSKAKLLANNDSSQICNHYLNMHKQLAPSLACQEISEWLTLLS